MTAETGPSYSGHIAASYSASPCPGPSNVSVAIPLSRKTFSFVSISSFAESNPIHIIKTGGFSTLFGFLRLPCICILFQLMLTLSPSGFANDIDFLWYSTAKLCVFFIIPGLCTNKNFPK